MSDELERRLRDAGGTLPDPAPDDTLTARAAFLAAASAPGRRPARRGLVLALAAALVAGGAFGVGYALAGSTTKTVTRTKVVQERLNAGPGFLPADGWTTGVAIDPGTGSIVGATAASANGTRIDARVAPASSSHGPTQAARALPLQLPAGGRRRHLLARVGAYAIDVTVVLPASHPAPVVAAAREELGRLVVPSCPAALPLASGTGLARTAAKLLALSEAQAFVLHWLPAHYAGDPAEVAGATAGARPGAAMPRHGEAVAACGARVAARSVEVDVTLPKRAKAGASRSQLTFFVARTRRGWTVWKRVP